MRSSVNISIVGCHAEGEVGDVIIGGVNDAPKTCKTMYDKLVYFLNEKDDIRQLVLNEPRGRSSMNVNLLLPPCNPDASMGFLIMESDEYAHMSGSNTICVSTVLLETGIIPMVEPITKFNLDTAAGLISVTAECENGKCKSVEFANTPSFVVKLDLEVDVPGLGKVLVDIVWGGMWFAFVDASSCGMKLENEYGPRLVELGQRIKRAVQRTYTPVHPENPEIKGVTILSFFDPPKDSLDGKVASNAVVVSPGRFDRSPTGTGTSARMAIMHARGQLKVGETFRHKSFIGTEFVNHIVGTTKVGQYDAIYPVVKGRAWITGTKNIMLDPTDPFPQGFRVSDQWHVGIDPV